MTEIKLARYDEILLRGLHTLEADDVTVDPDKLAAFSAKVGAHVSLEMFGAAGDGTTDDIAAWNAAKAYVNNAGGGKILLTRPSYFFSAPLEINTTAGDKQIELEGRGSANTRIVVGHSGAGIFIHGTGLPASQPIRLRGFRIDPSTSRGGTHGIHSSQAVIVDDVLANNMGSHGIFLENRTGSSDGVPYESLLINSKGFNCGGDGINVGSSVNAIRIFACMAQNNAGRGLYLAGEGQVVTAGDFSYNTGANLYLDCISAQVHTPYMDGGGMTIGTNAYYLDVNILGTVTITDNSTLAYRNRIMSGGTLRSNFNLNDQRLYYHPPGGSVSAWQQYDTGADKPAWDCSGTLGGYSFRFNGTETFLFKSNGEIQGWGQSFILYQQASPNSLYLLGTSDTLGGIGRAVHVNAPIGNKVAGTCRYTWNTGTSGTYEQFYHSSGGTASGSISYSTGTVAYNTTSDGTLKTDIEDVSGALDAVAALRPVTFRWIADVEGKADEERQMMPKLTGFIAQEVEPIFPQAVSRPLDPDGNPMHFQMDPSKLVPFLVGAIQELRARVAALEAS